MKPSIGWRAYCTPLNLAAYATLIAIAISLWQRPPLPYGTGFLATPWVWIVVLALFLLGFVIATVWSERKLWLGNIGIALMLLTTLALVIRDRSNIVAALLVITASVATARLAPATVAALLLIANGAVFWILTGRVDTGDAALIVAIYGGFQAFGAFASHAFRRANEAAAQVQEVNAHLLATRSLLAESARDGERLRLSRELHDVAGHKLTALKINLALLGQDSVVAQRAEFSAARELAHELLDDLRGVVSQLRRHDGIDLQSALQRLADVLPTPRIEIDVQPDARIDDSERAAALLRIAQEALTNAAKHSGARNAQLRLRRDGDSLELSVEDDGARTAEIQDGHGIAGMRERAAMLGGSLNLESGSTGGLRVRLRVPRERPT